MQVNLREGLLQAASDRSDDLAQGTEGLAQEVLQGEDQDSVTTSVSKSSLLSQQVRISWSKHLHKPLRSAGRGPG